VSAPSEQPRDPAPAMPRDPVDPRKPAPEPAPPAAVPRMPRQIPFIIGNEACERFSFYGMRNILTEYLKRYLLIGIVLEAERNAAATEVFHTFVMGVYFFPLLGGWLADRYLGKYRTIFWLSLVYCAGHACLAMFEGRQTGFYAGLFLIALGSGGIKPCVSSFMGDQFDQTNKSRARVAYDMFYWIINFGSFFASYLMPKVLRGISPAWAFGIPGILMFIATVIFWAGRRRYVNVPPSPEDPHSFSQIARTALLARVPGRGRPGLVLASAGSALALASVALYPLIGLVAALCLALVVFLAAAGVGVLLQLDRARGAHPDADVEGVRAVLKVLVIFALVTPFWSLFDQKASTWVIQAEKMGLPGWLESGSQMQALNPLLVMLLVPFNNLVLYPALGRIGITPTPLRRMTYGIAFAGLAWIAAGSLQLAIEGGAQVSVLWQALPYLLLTFGEVLVSATGLEFAYSQAPAKLKGVLMSFWLLTTTVGSLWVLLVNASVKNPSVTASIKSTGIGVMSFQMFFFAAFAFAAALAFGAYARRYRMADHYRTA
jgi:proton-dependent oligopeptide transporter, POT family